MTDLPKSNLVFVRYSQPSYGTAAVFIDKMTGKELMFNRSSLTTRINNLSGKMDISEEQRALAGMPA